MLTLTDNARHAVQDIATRAGLPDDGSVIPSAVDLNNLDDWTEFHKSIVGS